MKIILIGLFFSIQTLAALPLEKIKLPPGFKISVFADGVSGARSMTWGAKGTLFVGSRTEGKVFAITSDGKVKQIAQGLNQPNGVAFRDGSLYVAEVHRLIRFPKIESNLDKPLKFESLATFPNDTHHGWKFMAFGPDGRLYIAQGAPCNICEVKDPYATIQSIDANGKDLKTYARGIRNSVGFDWHPTTKQLWFTDNGRDMLGDDVPPDELNVAPKADMNFGFPYCHGGDLLDPEYGKGKKCADFAKPAQKLGAHVAALGMRFYTGTQFPGEYKNQILIAEHGSWNRSKPIGYRVSLVTVNEQSQGVSYKVFAEGWLQGDKAWGRPADVILAQDGSLLVSDDQASVIYRISYQK